MPHIPAPLALPAPEEMPVLLEPPIEHDEFEASALPIPPVGVHVEARDSDAEDHESEAELEPAVYEPVAFGVDLARPHADLPAEEPGPVAEAAVHALMEEWTASGLPLAFDGQPLALEPWFGEQQRYVRLRARCSNPLHGGSCATSRRLRFTRNFGVQEAWGCIGCWLSASTSALHGRSRAKHSQ